MPPQPDAPSNTRALLSHLEQLRDSLSDRVDQLSTAVERLRSQASELETAVTAGAPAPPRPAVSASGLLPLPLPLPILPLPRLHDPVVELSRSMDGLTVETRILHADHRGLPPTNLERVAAAPRPVIVRAPERAPDAVSGGEEAPEAPEPPADRPPPSSSPPLPRPVPALAPAPALLPVPTPNRPENGWEWFMHPTTARPPGLATPGLTTRGMLVRARQAPEETQPQPAPPPRAERDTELDRDAREAERLDRAIARYQRRHDESQREFHSAWDSERARAVGGGRVPNEHSAARADALRRHVDNAHRLWQLMHQRGRLATTPAAEPDAPLEMRHLLGTPSFRRGPLRPRRPIRPAGTGWLERHGVDARDNDRDRDRDRDRAERGDSFAEWFRQFTLEIESDDDSDWSTRRAVLHERLMRMRSSLAEAAAGTQASDSDAARIRSEFDSLIDETMRLREEGERRGVERERRRGERERRRDESLRRLTSTRREGVTSAADLLRASTDDWRARHPTLAQSTDAPVRARAPPALDTEPTGLDLTLPRLPRPRADEESLLGDDGDTARRALLRNLRATLARLNAQARDMYGGSSADPDLDFAASVERVRERMRERGYERTADDDVLERVERARERVAQLSRIQRDLEAVRAGMRRGSDATVVPDEWPASRAANAAAATAGDGPDASDSAVDAAADESELDSAVHEAIAVVVRAAADEPSDASASASSSESSGNSASETEGAAAGGIASASASEESGAESDAQSVPADAIATPAGATTGSNSGGARDDADKERGNLRADTWPAAPNRARNRPYVSLLDL